MNQTARMTERMNSPTEVLVVLPTYNESQNLEKVVAGVRHFGHDVLIVDDASPDGTGESSRIDWRRRTPGARAAPPAQAGPRKRV